MARSDRDFVLEEDDSPSRARLALRLMLERPVEVAGVLVLVAASAAILVNALFLQQGQHPAPLFRSAGVAAPAADSPPLPPVRQVESLQMQALVRLIQTELAARGHDIGEIDGMLGPKTDAAIRAFQESAGLEVDGQPTNDLLEVLRSRRASSAAADPIEHLINTGAPPKDRRLFAIESTLAKFAYGPLKVDGVIDADTRAAIQRFERSRGLPPTGEVSNRLIQELSRMAGAPIE